MFATSEMAEWSRSGPYLRALAEWGFDSRLATRFAILGSNLFASSGERGRFLYYCGVVIEVDRSSSGDDASGIT
jgi:hypothetical protein